ncbi:MAG TPA: hypothetical protein VMS75_10550 [Terriglobales bacterium]|nr:hypothetical protein [Terriglobales bacterium]
MKKTGIVILATLALAAGSALAQAKNPPAKDIPENVLGVFKRNCAGCHAGLTAPKGLKLVPGKVASAIDAPSKEAPALKLIDTADPAASYLLKKVEGAAGIQGKKMPPGKTLPEADLKTLKDWILGLRTKSPDPAAAPHLSWNRTVTVKTIGVGLPSLM